MTLTGLCVKSDVYSLHGRKERGKRIIVSVPSDPGRESYCTQTVFVQPGSRAKIQRRGSPTRASCIIGLSLLKGVPRERVRNLVGARVWLWALTRDSQQAGFEMI